MLFRPLNRRAMLGLLGSGVLLAALPKASLANTAPDRRLLWKRPVLDNPRTIDVHSNSPISITQKLDPNTDYIIRIGPDSGGMVTRSTISIIGGRNIQVIGGHMKRADHTPCADGNGGPGRGPSATFSVFNHTGTAYIEGLLIDANNQYGADAINVGAVPVGQTPAPSVIGDYIFQNIHVRGVSGTMKGNHADGLQTVGPIEKLWAHRVTIYSAYQGFIMWPRWAIKDFLLDTCNTRYPDPDFKNGHANGFAFFIGSGHETPEQVAGAHYRFKNVYVQPRTNYWDLTWAEGTVAPSRKWPRANQNYNGDPDRVYFPGYNATGYVTKGIPPQGDFMPADWIVDQTGRVVYDPTQWS